MKKLYAAKSLPLIAVSFFLFTVTSCKKDKKVTPTPPQVVDATPTKIGLYEADSSIYKLLFADISKIGNNTQEYDLIFDTGSGGMVIDGNGLLPASMITDNGFTFTGDSTTINGITVTNQKSMVEYGDDDATTDKVYGNLAYASVTIGNQSGNIVVKRLPFFIYYKAVDSKGVKFDVHEFDTFGVSPEYDISFPNNAYITSPFSYFDPGTGLTKGFKMAALGTSNFTNEGNYVQDALTLGLTADDLSSSSGFISNQLNLSNYGYPPTIPGTITYNNNIVSTSIVFDTGTEPYGYIEDPSYNGNTTLLPENTPITYATTSGFSYSVVTSANDNLTYIENPNTSGGEVSIASLEFFLNNEYMLNYTGHTIGLKNN